MRLLSIQVGNVLLVTLAPNGIVPLFLLCCLRVSRRYLLNVTFLGRMNVCSSSSHSSIVVFASTFVCGNFREWIFRPSIPKLRYINDLAFVSAMSHGLSPHKTPIRSIWLHSFFHLAIAWLYLVIRSLSIVCVGFCTGCSSTGWGGVKWLLSVFAGVIRLIQCLS